jgi:hypothetical protein
MTNLLNKHPAIFRCSATPGCYNNNIIIIIIIILGISFMQGICTYIPETNHVPSKHCVATILM